jgi:hypothetical protein
MVWSIEAMNKPMETMAKISRRRSFWWPAATLSGAALADWLDLVVSPVALTVVY